MGGGWACGRLARRHVGARRCSCCPARRVQASGSWRAASAAPVAAATPWYPATGLLVSRSRPKGSGLHAQQFIPAGLSALPACSAQDLDKLQPGGFYLDRHLQPKHLPLAGTKYSAADVDRLWEVLEKLAAPALPLP